MLGAREDGIFVQLVALKTPHGGRAEFRDELRRFTKAFISATPANISRNCNTRSESPLDSRAFDFFSSHTLGFFDQRRIVGRAHPNVVRKNDRTENIIMAVN